MAASLAPVWELHAKKLTKLKAPCFSIEPSQIAPSSRSRLEKVPDAALKKKGAYPAPPSLNRFSRFRRLSEPLAQNPQLLKL